MSEKPTAGLYFGPVTAMTIVQPEPWLKVSADGKVEKYDEEGFRTAAAHDRLTFAFFALVKHILETKAPTQWADERAAFEQAFPVPDNVRWSEEHQSYGYIVRNSPNLNQVHRYRSMWKVWQQARGVEAKP